MDLALVGASARAGSGLGLPSRGSLLDFGSSAQKRSIHENASTRGEIGEAEQSRSAAGGGSGDIEIAVLIPLVLVANTIVATIAWYASARC
jgi:hypothetical protein